MTNKSIGEIAKEITSLAIDYGMSAPYPRNPTENPLPICETDLIKRISIALQCERTSAEEAEKKVEVLKEALIEIDSNDGCNPYIVAHKALEQMK